MMVVTIFLIVPPKKLSQKTVKSKESNSLQINLKTTITTILNIKLQKVKFIWSVTI